MSIKTELLNSSLRGLYVPVAKGNSRLRRSHRMIGTPGFSAPTSPPIVVLDERDIPQLIHPERRYYHLQANVVSPPLSISHPVVDY
jgi:hypothetical protein